MEHATIVEKLKKLIEEQDSITIDGPDQELDIDSYTMMLIITFVDEDMEIQLDMDTLDFDAFKSLNTLANIVEKSSSI